MKFCNRTEIEFVQYWRSFLLPCQFRKRLQRDSRFLVLKPWYGIGAISQISTAKAGEVLRKSKSHPSSLPQKAFNWCPCRRTWKRTPLLHRVLQSWGKVLIMALEMVCLSPLPHFTPFILDMKALIRRNGSHHPKKRAFI